ncbi:MAG: outer membrane lipoprotein-sorting protein [Candidatus Atribacteria bacterium]|nr:outer membrane lipoprotein-sorting protein [Candidatus Atribacteria bacterium]
MKKLLCLITIILIALISVPSWAMTADEILDEVEARTTKFETQKSVAKMTLIDSKGKEEAREMVMYSKDEGEDVVSIIVRFLNPADVKGVTLLSIKGGESMYLYMPAFKKVRRIASSEKNEKFMGTDFTYDELGGSYSREDYNSTLIEETEEIYKLELIPQDPESNYSKLLMEVDKEKFYFRKIEFYDKDANLWKTLEIPEIEEEEDGSITVKKINLTDLKENHKTTIEMGSIEKNIPLPDNFFSVRTVQRPEL